MASLITQRGGDWVIFYAVFVNKQPDADMRLLCYLNAVLPIAVLLRCFEAFWAIMLQSK